MGKSRPSKILEDGFREGSKKEVRFNDKAFDKLIAQKRREKEERIKYIEKVREEEETQKEMERENVKMDRARRDKQFYDKHGRLPN